MFDILPNFLTYVPHPHLTTTVFSIPVAILGLLKAYIDHHTHSTLTILLPIYASHKALSATSTHQTPLHQQTALLTPWLTYFLVLSLFHLTESYLWPLTWLPLYAYARLGAHIYLLLPGQNQGATYIYNTHIAPFLSRHEVQIENFIARSHTQLRALGLGHAEAAIEWAKVSLMGLPRSEGRNWAAEAARGPPSSNNYVASLLGRFTPPGGADAGAGAASLATGGASAMAGFLGTALAQASSLATAPSGSVGAAKTRGVDGKGTNDALIPPGLANDEERLAYIARRREELKVLLGAFEKEEQEIHLAGTGATGNGSGIGRSKSEAEFETIASVDAPASPKQGAGWGGWFSKGSAGKGGKEN